jgi:hypothetical protein
MPSIIDRLLKRAPKTEENPFTGETVKVIHVPREEIDLRYNIKNEDRLDRLGGILIRSIAMIVTAYNFLMFLGYISKLDLFFSGLFIFSCYFSLVFLKRANRELRRDL